MLIPLIYTEALPKQQLMGYLVRPATPTARRPRQPQRRWSKVLRPVTEIDNGQLKAPTAIPKKIAMITEDEAPPQYVAWLAAWSAASLEDRLAV